MTARSRMRIILRRGAMMLALAFPLFTATADATPRLASCRGAAPTIVLVHGAWADSSSWNGEVERLRDAGYAVRAVANPLQGLTSDAATVASFLATLRGPIVLV